MILDNMDFWRLCDELSIIQATLLIVGVDPSDHQFSVEGNAKSPTGYEAGKAALVNAINGGRLSANVKFEVIERWDPDSECMFEDTNESLDVHETTIELEELKRWLLERGFSEGFFFTDQSTTAPYLDEKNPRYASKLAATVRAWLSIESEDDLEGKSPKQALMRWLRENGRDYNLTDEEGKPNETGIEECAKVANWQEKGGAPKTPSG